MENDCGIKKMRDTVSCKWVRIPHTRAPTRTLNQCISHQEKKQSSKLRVKIHNIGIMDLELNRLYCKLFEHCTNNY